MTIPSLCKSISSTLSRNLSIAISDEQRHSIAAETLNEMGKRLFPELDKLLADKGEASDDYLQAREVVLDLLSFVTIHFVRNCSNFRRGIQFLEELTERSGNSQVKKKLVIYANQLKKRWNEADANSVAHNPRAKRVRCQINTSPKLTNVILIVFSLVGFLYFIAPNDLTSLVFPHWNEARTEPAPQTQIDSKEGATQTSQNIPAEPQAGTTAKPLDQAGGSFYAYTDEQGIFHMVNDLEKVPQNYRHRMKITHTSEPRGNVTSVVINGNLVFVPVKLSFHGRYVDTYLLLDTGASVTTISGRLAARLGVEASDVQSGKSTVADGRSLQSYMFVVDSLTVGSHTLSNVRAAVLPGSGGEGHEGLLGMDFLKNYRYHVDFERSVIEWGA